MRRDDDRGQNDDRECDKLGRLCCRRRCTGQASAMMKKCAGDRCQDGAAEVKGNEDCDDCNRKAGFFKLLHGSGTRRGACPPASSKAMS